MESVDQRNAQVFESICQLVANPDFNQGQVNFINAHAHKFDDEEENKHEYFQLHQEYIGMLEQAIDIQLGQTYSSQEIEFFYKCFPNDYQVYMQTNSDIVELLNGYINFDQFKQQMLKMKGGVVNLAKKDQGHIDTGEQGMTFEVLIQEDINNPATGWKKVSQSNDARPGYIYTIHARPYDIKAHVNLARIDMELQGLTQNAWYEMLKDGPPFENAVERKVLSFINENEKIVYVKLRLGAFISDRDNVLSIKRIYMDDGSMMMLIRSVQHPDAPEQANIIRAEFIKLQRIEQAGNNLKITDFSIMNLKGYFPIRLFNMMIGTILSKAVPKIYAIAKKIQAQS